MEFVTPRVGEGFWSAKLSCRRRVERETIPVMSASKYQDSGYKQLSDQQESGEIDFSPILRLQLNNMLRKF